MPSRPLPSFTRCGTGWPRLERSSVSCSSLIRCISACSASHWATCWTSTLW